VRETDREREKCHSVSEGARERGGERGGERGREKCHSVSERARERGGERGGERGRETRVTFLSFFFFFSHCLCEQAVEIFGIDPENNGIDEVGDEAFDDICDDTSGLFCSLIGLFIGLF
jgi:hypothetical protein